MYIVAVLNEPDALLQSSKPTHTLNKCILLQRPDEVVEADIVV